MAKVKVWNKNEHPYKEMFKGEEINIPAGECIEMEWEEAIEFKGQFTPMKMLANGTPDPKFFKKIFVERPAQLPFKDERQVFHATGQQFNSPAELISFAKAYAAANPEAIAPAAAAGDEAVSMPKAAYDMLLGRIAALESQNAPAKKGPGRPKKEAHG